MQAHRWPNSPYLPPARCSIAWIVFRENVDKRVGAGFTLILLGAVLLSLPQEGGVALSEGALLIAAACMCWGVDNNLTRKISGSDPSQIAMWKGLAAGTVNTSLALAIGAKLPAIGITLGVTAIGFLGYGVSLVLFIRALRDLGTARTGAISPPRPLQALRWPSQLDKAASIGRSALRAFSCLSASGYTSPSDTNTSMSTNRWNTSIFTITTSITSTSTLPTIPPGEPHAHRHLHAVWYMLTRIIPTFITGISTECAPDRKIRSKSDDNRGHQLLSLVRM